MNPEEKCDRSIFDLFILHQQLSTGRSLDKDIVKWSRQSLSSAPILRAMHFFPTQIYRILNLYCTAIRFDVADWLTDQYKRYLYRCSFKALCLEMPAYGAIVMLFISQIHLIFLERTVCKPLGSFIFRFAVLLFRTLISRFLSLSPSLSLQRWRKKSKS